MPEVRWFLVYTYTYTEYLPRNYSIDMQSTIEQVDKDYIESTKSLRPLQKYGSTVNRRLVEIYTKYTGEKVEQKSCCSSERSIFYTEFMKWYEGTI